MNVGDLTLYVLLKEAAIPFLLSSTVMRRVFAGWFRSVALHQVEEAGEGEHSFWNGLAAFIWISLVADVWPAPIGKPV